MQTALLFFLAALSEIGGCFAVWAWWRLGAPLWWLLAAAALLGLFAFALANLPAAFAGRAFAAYGGIYIAASLGWGWMVEGQRPDAWDLAGAALCLMGATLIIAAPRG